MADNQIDIRVVVDAEGAARTFNTLGDEISTAEQSANRASQGFSKTQASIITLSSVADLAAKAVGFLRDAFESVGEGIKRGSEVDDIASSFDNLAQKAGVASDVFLNDLNESLGETIPNLDLMKQANELLIGGIKPDKIKLLGDAARALGEQTGVDAAQGMNALADSILRGNGRAVEQLGIIIDDNKALAEFAERNGIAADRILDLSEETRKLAIREAVFKELSKQSENFGKVTIDAGDQIVRAGKLITDKFDEVYRSLASDAGVNAALESFIGTIKSIDLAAFTSALAGVAREIILLGDAAVKVASYSLTQFKAVLDSISGKDFAFNTGLSEIFAPLTGAASEASKLIDKSLTDIVDNLSKDVPAASDKARQSFIALTGAIKSGSFPVVAVQKYQEQLKLVAGQVEAATGPLHGLNNATEENADVTKTAEQTLKTMRGELDKGPKSFFDVGKAAQKAAQETKQLTEATNAYRDTVRKALGYSELTALEKKLESVFVELKSGQTTTEQAAQAIDELARDSKGSAEALKEFSQALGIAEQSASGVVDEMKELNDAVREAQQYDNPIEFLFTGKGSKSGSIFGDLFSSGEFEGGLSEAFSNSIGPAIVQGIQQGVKEGFSPENIKGLSSSLLKSIPNAFGQELTPFGAALVDIGVDFLGDAVESIFGGEDAGTTARKAADKFFADAFDANRLLVVINGQLQQISDLVFRGDTLFGGNVDFADGSFSQYLSTLPAEAQQAFGGVGLAFEELLGVSGDISGQIASVLANNIGGSLNNLQLLVESTGKSFEELRGYVVEAFLDGKISALEAQSALNGLAQVAQKGIPDGVGFTVQALHNLEAAGVKGGRASIDALQDIGYEAKELGLRTFPDLIANLQASGEFTAEEIDQLFAALSASGIDSIDKLVNATNEQLIGVLSQLQAQEFPFADAVSDAADLVDTLDRLPNEKTLTFNVKTNFDENTKTAIDQQYTPKFSNASTSFPTAGSSPGIQ